MKILYLLLLFPFASFAQIDKEIDEEVFRHQRLIRNLQRSVDSLRSGIPQRVVKQKAAVDPAMQEDFVAEILKLQNERKEDQRKYFAAIRRLDSLVSVLSNRLAIAESQNIRIEKGNPISKATSTTVRAKPEPVQNDTVQYAPGQFSSYPASSEMYKLMYDGQKLKPHPAPERDPGYIDYQQDQLLPTTYKAEKERKERAAAPSNYGYTPSTGATIHTGPRGGRYYINSNGNKTYIKRK